MRKSSAGSSDRRCPHETRRNCYEFWDSSDLVSLRTKDATNSACVFGEPAPHPVIRPRPFEGVSIQPVVLRPRRLHMGDVLLLTRPRPPLQVAAPEGMVEQLPLVQPGGMRRGQPGTPPAMATGEVVGRLAGDVAGPAVMDQEDAPEFTMLPPEPIQFRDVVLGIVGLQADGLHLARMDH